MYGPPVPETREALTRGFQEKYPDIHLQYTGASGSELPPKIVAERQAGMYAHDILVNGTAFHRVLIEAGAMDPLRDYLAGPNSSDLSKWLDPNFEPDDQTGTYVHPFAYIAKVPLAYNQGQVAAGEVKSYRDLLNPKWRGKVAIHDPRSGGAGQGLAAFLYSTDGLGKPYLEQLLQQGLILTRDERQLLDWVVRGQHALALAPSELVVNDLRAKGVSPALLGAQDLEEGSFLTVGAAVIAVANRGPHPNAARVYLDWLLSPEAQLAYSKATGYVSRRTDVPTDHLPAYAVPQPGVRYMETWQQSYFKRQQDVGEFFRTATGS
jgi:iron(III) transport system substrate-binding protein